MEKLDSFFWWDVQSVDIPHRVLVRNDPFFNLRRVVRMRKDLGFVLLVSVSQVKGRQGLAYA